jgi:hypothetical protein
VAAPTATWIARGIDALGAAMFAFAAWLQLNDPDPVQWVAIYLAAAGLALAGPRHRRAGAAAALVAAVAVVWALSLAPDVVGRTSWGKMTETWKMQREDAPTEEAREMGGLAVVVVWMSVAAVRGLGRRRDQRAAR